MRAADFSILDDVFEGYDKTKTSVAGRIRKRENPFAPFGGSQVIGPPPTRFIDTYSDSNLHFVVVVATHITDNNRLFVAAMVTAGFASIGCYEVDPVTLNWTWVGRLIMAIPNLAATTHTIRAIRVLDSGTTGWKIFVATSGSVLVNGGVTLANKVDRSDFFPAGGTTIWAAQTDDVKGTYHLVRAYGQANAMTAAIGIALDGTEILCASGTPAAFTTQGIDSTIVPTVESRTAASNTSSPHFSLTAHGLVDGQQVIISSAGNVPTGFTGTAVNATQTVYFVRDSLANTFNLAATNGGAAAVATSAVSGVIVRRAFGQTTALDIAARAATYTASGLSGTALNNAIQIDTPTTGPTAGEKSVFMMTSTTIGLFPKASLSASGAAPAGISAVNVSGSGVDYTAWNPVAMNWDQSTQRVVIGTQFGIGQKALINSQTDGLIGCARTDWRDSFQNDQRATRYCGQTIVMVDAKAGIGFVCASTAGQRGVFVLPFDADTLHGTSYLITRVVDLGAVSDLDELSFVQRGVSETGPVLLYYRTATSSADALFDSATGGWTLVTGNASGDGRLRGITGRAVQCRIEWSLRDQMGCAAQLSRLLITYSPTGDPADEFVADVTHCVVTGGIGNNRAAWQLRTPFAGTAVIPALSAFAYDTTDTLQSAATTTANAAVFEYSADGGGSWLPWSASIPNTAGTLIRWALGASNSANWIVSLRRS